ncbi:MAG: tetraacyldisaccharide 4'-kinase [Bdellovibrio sp.]|nr:tetraacyldisaccharide 4'-kinase [Bdellovibrio sp.]
MQVVKKILRIFLQPFAILWESVYRLRRAAYNYGTFERFQFKVPIISVGNLSFGGTGKTPFTLWLGKFLEAKQKKVMILTRGYKGRLEGQQGILHSGRRLGFNPQEFGDEALLFAMNLKHASIVIGKNRSQNLIDYFPSEKPDVVLLDDGHQHLKLARDLNIVLFDAVLPLSSYQVAPLGYLREGPTALRDADIVIINRSDLVPGAKIEALQSMIKKYISPTVPIGLIGYQSTGLFNSRGELAYPTSSFAGLRVFAMAGVASPESFFKTLQNYEMNLVGVGSYPDHHFYTSEEISKVLSKANDQNAIVVVTEKDIVKIRHLVNDLPIYYLGIEIKFYDQEEKIKEMILSFC